MIITIAKSDTTKVEGITAAEERKFHYVFSMVRIKAIGRTNVPSPSRGKKSLIGRIPSQRSQSIIPHSCRNSLRQWLPLGLRRQIGRCHIRFTTTTRCRTSTKCHLLNNQCQCYPLHNIVKHGRGAPHHSLMTQQVYPNLRSLSRGRYQSEQATRPPAVGLTSSTPSPEGQTNQCWRQRGNAKNASELSLM